MLQPFINLQGERTAKSRGFTLLELLVVLAVLGMLMAVVAPQIMSRFSGAKSDTAALQIETIITSLNYFKLDTGRYPSTEEGLTALWEAPADAGLWRGPYIRKLSHLTDPWGRAYRYRNPGKYGEVDVYTFGADDMEKGEGENADIGSWDSVQ